MKKGFTLIELLAVIVILAIIALIAAPIVLNIIEESKESSTVRSGEFYLSAVENSVMNYKMNGNQKYVPKSCLIVSGGNILCDDEIIIEVELDGEKPDGGIIKFEKGKISSSELMYESITIRTNDSVVWEKVDSFVKSSNHEIVYFDVSTGKSCKESDYNELNSKTGYNGINKTEDEQNSCLKFYIFNDNGGNTVNLLLDHNTTDMVAWNLSGVNASGPNEVLTQLKQDTQNWIGTVTPTNYTVGGYTINYTGYKARLITAEEIAQIVGNTTWDETLRGNSYYFATKTTTASQTCTLGNTSGCKYSWLYDRTSDTCKAEGCLNNALGNTSGYWTATYKSALSTEIAHREMCNGNLSYGVSSHGRVGYSCVNNFEHYGVRPVITVLRNNI